MHGTLPLTTRPAWFPDWSGDICALIGAGESATPDAVEALRGRARVMVVNTSYQLAPWADALYACDGRWWSAHKGAPEFTGCKITQDKDAAKRFGLNLVSLIAHDHPFHDNLLLDRPGLIGRGGNGGFQAFNLLLQFGARRIITILDFRGGHWHGKHPEGLSNPRPQSLEKWAAIFDAQAALLAELGIKLIDCAVNGALRAYPKMGVDEALRTLSA